MKFRYYYGSQADQFSFIRIPRALLTDKMFAALSVQAKLLYGVLLDRMSLSMKNGWFDEKNRVYIIYQISEIMEDLGFSKKKSMDYLKELEEFGLLEKKRRGLGLPSILYVKSFLVDKDLSCAAQHDRTDNPEVSGDGTSGSVDMGTSGRIEEESGDSVVTSSGDENADGECVITIDSDNPKAGNTIEQTETGDMECRSADLRTSGGDDSETSRGADAGTSGGVDFGTSRGATSELQEVPKRGPLKNNIYRNNTYRNQTKSNQLSSGILGIHAPTSVPESTMDSDAMREERAVEAVISENISLPMLLEAYPQDQELVQGIYDLIVETVVGKRDTIMISGSEYPAGVVKSKFMKLDFEHIQYVVDCFNRNTTKVHNIRKYLLAALFNAPSTMGSYYSAEVRHDFPQYAKQ